MRTAPTRANPREAGAPSCERRENPEAAHQPSATSRAHQPSATSRPPPVDHHQPTTTSRPPPADPTSRPPPRRPPPADDRRADVIVAFERNYRGNRFRGTCFVARAKSECATFAGPSAGRSAGRPVGRRLRPAACTADGGRPPVTPARRPSPTSGQLGRLRPRRPVRFDRPPLRLDLWRRRLRRRLERGCAPARLRGRRSRHS
jgi:hypothetical protein